MDSTLKNIYYSTLLLTVMAGCRKPYNPPAITASNSYLVVEGIINSGSDSTIIKLSRTVNLSSGTTNNPETGASISVQSNTNNSYPLTETSMGHYSVPGLNLDVTKTYRLSITTSKNQQYISDFEPVKVTPPVDSVGFATLSDGIQLYVNTHDPNNNTHYYRWEYAETWQFHSKYFSSYVSNGTQIVQRTDSQLVYNCFGNDANSDIVLGSSAKLTRDVIDQGPLVKINSTSEKLETKYSILVTQYALTSDAYTFYSNLKKNTEQLGSIFDAEPSEIAGNIHNVNNATEPVLGYISVGTTESKRIFVSNSQLPQSWTATYPYTCQEDTFYFSAPVSGLNQVSQSLTEANPDIIPTFAVYARGTSSIIGYLAAEAQCVDCTLRGTTTQPSFWK